MLGSLIGKQIIQVAIDEFQIQLRIEEDHSICTQNFIEFFDNKNKFVCEANKPETSAPLLSCVGDILIDIYIDDEKSLNIKLKKGALLIIKCLDDGYESCQVNFPHDFLVY